LQPAGPVAGGNDRVAVISTTDVAALVTADISHIGHEKRNHRDFCVLQLNILPCFKLLSLCQAGRRTFSYHASHNERIVVDRQTF